MSEYRAQALVEAPVEEIWELVGDPRRHPLWWPRVIEVQGSRFEVGDAYVQISEGPIGRETTKFMVEEFKGLREIKMRCLATGTYAHWHMTEAQGNTFLEVEFGMDPKSFGNRIFDLTFGRPYFRRWLDKSVQALKEAAEKKSVGLAERPPAPGR